MFNFPSFLPGAISLPLSLSLFFYFGIFNIVSEHALVCPYGKVFVEEIFVILTDRGILACKKIFAAVGWSSQTSNTLLTDKIDSRAAGILSLSWTSFHSSLGYFLYPHIFLLPSFILSTFLPPLSKNTHSLSLAHLKPILCFMTGSLAIAKCQNSIVKTVFP